MTYIVTYKDALDDEHDVVVSAKSGTHALAIAMEMYTELKLHPDRITRVIPEKKA